MPDPESQSDLSTEKADTPSAALEESADIESAASLHDAVDSTLDAVDRELANLEDALREELAPAHAEHFEAAREERAAAAQPLETEALLTAADVAEAEALATSQPEEVFDEEAAETAATPPPAMESPDPLTHTMPMAESAGDEGSLGEVKSLVETSTGNTDAAADDEPYESSPADVTEAEITPAVPEQPVAQGDSEELAAIPAGVEATTEPDLGEAENLSAPSVEAVADIENRIELSPAPPAAPSVAPQAKAPAGAPAPEEPATAPASPRLSVRILRRAARIATAPFRLPLLILVLLDIPFSRLGHGIKNLLGYIGIATGVMAAATWLFGPRLLH